MSERAEGRGTAADQLDDPAAESAEDLSRSGRLLPTRQESNLRPPARREPSTTHPVLHASIDLLGCARPR